MNYSCGLIYSATKLPVLIYKLAFIASLLIISQRKYYIYLFLVIR